MLLETYLYNVLLKLHDGTMCGYICVCWPLDCHDSSSMNCGYLSMIWFMKIPHMSILALYELLILTCYMWIILDSIWDIEMYMMMHVRHNDIGNVMILVLNTMVYEYCVYLTWLIRNGKLARYPNTCNRYTKILGSEGRPKVVTKFPYSSGSEGRPKWSRSFPRN